MGYGEEKDKGKGQKAKVKSKKWEVKSEERSIDRCYGHK